MVSSVWACVVTSLEGLGGPEDETQPCSYWQPSCLHKGLELTQDSTAEDTD